MEWLRQLSDDQLALLGCLGAMIVAFGMLSISYYAGVVRVRNAEARVGNSTPEVTRRRAA